MPCDKDEVEVPVMEDTEKDNAYAFKKLYEYIYTLLMDFKRLRTENLHNMEEVEKKKQIIENLEKELDALRSLVEESITSHEDETKKMKEMIQKLEQELSMCNNRYNESIMQAEARVVEQQRFIDAKSKECVTLKKQLKEETSKHASMNIRIDNKEKENGVLMKTLDDLKKQYQVMYDKFMEERDSHQKETESLNRTISELDIALQSSVNQASFHKQSADVIMDEVQDLQCKNSTEMDSLKEQLNSSHETCKYLQKTLQLSIQWNLHYAKKLREAGLLDEENDESKLYTNLCEKKQNLNPDTDIILFCPVFDGISIPPAFETTVEGASATVKREQYCDGDYSEVTIPLRISSPRHDGPSSSDSEIDASDGRRCSPITGRKRKSQRGSELVSSPAKKVAGKTPAHASKHRKPQSSPLEEPIFTFNNNREMVVSFPITPLLKQQTVNLGYEEHRVTARYRRIKNDEEIASRRRSSGLSLLHRGSVGKNRDVIVLDSDETEVLEPRRNAAVAAPAQIDSHDIPCCSSSLINVPKNEEPSFEEAPRDIDQDSQFIGSNTEDEFDELSSLKSTSDVECCPLVPEALDVPLPHMETALKRLVFLTDDEQEMKGKSSLFQRALTKCSEAQESSAVALVVNHICATGNVPLQQFMDNRNKIILPVDELALVRAFNALAPVRPGFFEKLRTALRKKILDGKRLNLLALAALCRVYTSFTAVETSLNRAKLLLYDVLQKHANIGPYLVASIAFVWPSILDQPIQESEILLHRAVCYLVSTKPEGLNEHFWTTASYFLQHKCKIQSTTSAEELVESIMQDITSTSNRLKCPEDDAFNYVTAMNLLATRLGWHWVHPHVILKHLMPLIKPFVANARRRACSAAALAYKMIGILSTGQEGNEDVVKFVQDTCAELLVKKNHVPEYVLLEAFCALYRLQTERKDITLEDEAFKLWLVGQWA